MSPMALAGWAGEGVVARRPGEGTLAHSASKGEFGRELKAAKGTGSRAPGRREALGREGGRC